MFATYNNAVIIFMTIHFLNDLVLGFLLRSLWNSKTLTVLHAVLLALTQSSDFHIFMMGSISPANEIREL